MLNSMRDTSWATAEFQRLLPALSPARGQVIEELRVNDVHVASSWTVQYSVRIGSVGSGAHQDVSLNLQHFPFGNFTHVADQFKQRLAGIKQVSLRNLSGICPKSRLVVTPFPLDLKLDTLLLAADPGTALRRFLELNSEQYLADSVEVLPLRYLPGRRCQLSYRFFKGGVAIASVLGKVFRDDRGSALKEQMNRIADWCSAHGLGESQAPRSPGYLPDWRMLLQEEMPGETLFEHIRSGSWHADQFRCAGRALSLLHQIDLFSIPEYRIKDEQTLLQRSLNRLEGCGLGHAEFREALGSVAARAEGLPEMRSAVIHRDFYDKQLLLVNGQTTLIDLDTVAIGYAEMDAANFCSHLYLRALQGWLEPGKAHEAEQAFLEGYSSRGRALNGAGLDFFQRTTFFRLACKYHLLPENDRLVECLLDFSLRGAQRDFSAKVDLRQLGVLR